MKRLQTVQAVLLVIIGKPSNVNKYNSPFDKLEQ